MKAVKYLPLWLAMLVVTLCMASCSNDDDEVDDQALNDYYIEVEVSGGGLDSQEINLIESELNTTLSDIGWEKLTKDEAIYYFDKAVKAMQYEFSEGVTGFAGTLHITFHLKTSNGKTVKSSTLNITKDGCTID